MRFRNDLGNAAGLDKDGTMLDWFWRARSPARPTARPPLYMYRHPAPPRSAGFQPP